MAELKIPQKTLQDNFNLQDFKDDFNALNSEIEENKTLTDSEISRLKEIANTWETFKNTGGTIGGNVKFNNNNIEITNNIIQSNLSELALNDNNNYGYATVVLKNKGQGIGEFTAREGQNIDLGSPSVGFQDVYIQGLSKDVNGYTKLPNGMIMQWGQSGISSGQVSNTISFPIVFPNKFFSLTCNLTGSETVNPVDCMYSVGNITASYFNIHYNKPRNEYQGLSWIAIGY